MQTAATAVKIGAGAAATQASGKFVINLMASTTPMALAQPNHPHLKQFTFFITRRRQDHRERFRLHMGYFDSQQHAEAMLVKVREIFPSAWAGATPGKTEDKGAEPRPAAERRAITAAPFDMAQVNVAAALAAEPLPAPATAAATSVSPERSATAQSMRSVRAAIEALGDGVGSSAPTATPPPQLRVSTLSPEQVMQVLELQVDAVPETAAAAPAESPVAPPVAAAKPAELAAPEVAPLVLELLELPPLPAAQAAESNPAAAHTPTPAQPTVAKRPAIPARTLPVAPATALESEPAVASAPGAKSAGKRSAPPATAHDGFAVQLQWSAAAIEVSSLPYLAIFEAYTLYIAEGKRDGRHWFGLRLGFFSDTASAKQVAHYLRSEFASVSVVPVSARERSRAQRPTKVLLPSATPAAATNKSVEDYQLLDASQASRRPPTSKPLTDLLAPADVESVLTHAPVAAKASEQQPQRPPLTLEETLEILGANDMSLQDKSGEMLNQSAVRSLSRAAAGQPEVKRSALGRLFDRLGERLSA
jgi:hypothetical protein